MNLASRTKENQYRDISEYIENKATNNQRNNPNITP